MNLTFVIADLHAEKVTENLFREQKLQEANQMSLELKKG